MGVGMARVGAIAWLPMARTRRFTTGSTAGAGTTGVGLILFWPALFFIDGDGPEANEYARLKGEHEALQKASIEKKCGLPATTATTTTP